jgi:hypothetical protein
VQLHPIVVAQSAQSDSPAPRSHARGGG